MSPEKPTANKEVIIRKGVVSRNKYLKMMSFAKNYGVHIEIEAGPEKTFTKDSSISLELGAGEKYEDLLGDGFPDIDMEMAQLPEENESGILSVPPNNYYISVTGKDLEKFLSEFKKFDGGV